MTDALIIAGAVAKGAFAAGALAELFSPFTRVRLGLDVRRVVATSSGAVSGAFLASRLHDGAEHTGMPVLEELWIELGGARDVFDVSARALLGRRGISTAKKVRGLLERFIPPRPGTRPVELAVVVTNLSGEVDVIGAELATTYERCARFTGDAFESDAGLAPLFDAVVASSAFPVLFEPAKVRFGVRDVECLDGGACNNTPIKYALGDGSDVDRVFVITPQPALQPPKGSLRGVALLSHLAEVLTDERLFRDLKEAHEVNRALAALERAVPLASLRERALAALGWSGRRKVQIVEVRPREPLEGDVFAGFFSRRLREDYVEAGAAAARAALGGP